MRNAVVSLVLLWAGCSSIDRDRPHAAPSSITPLYQDAGTTDDAARSFIGVITAGESVNIAPRAAGVIRSVRVRTGDRVAAGDIIAEMDPALMRDELRAAQAAAESSSAALKAATFEAEDARRKLDLEIKSVAAGVSPAQNVDEQRSNVKRSEAAVERARSAYMADLARVQTARDQLTDTALRAPSAGSVALRFHDPGNRVAAGEPIARIVGNGKMILRFAVPPEQARSIVVDARVTATVKTLAGLITATIKQVSPAIDPASGMIIVDARLDEETADLRPGLEAVVVAQ